MRFNPIKFFLLIVFLSIFYIVTGAAQSVPLLKISDDRHHLVTQADEPFLWLGGTAWELLHRLSREDAGIYLKDRADKGFTVIQTVILAELDGLHTPNAYGELPLIDDDPTQLNEKYFEHVDFVIRKAAAICVVLPDKTRTL